MMIFFVFQCLYFMLPAYFANMAPVIMSKSFKKLAVPLDCGIKLKGKHFFGKNKTLRGLIFATLFSIIISSIQFVLFRFDFFAKLSFFDYSNWFFFGFLMGTGAILGDLAESFLKRRINMKPGHPFIPWDQTDFVFGSLLFVTLALDVTWKMVFFIVMTSLVGHVLVNHIAYYLKIRKERW